MEWPLLIYLFNMLLVLHILFIYTYFSKILGQTVGWTQGKDERNAHVVIPLRQLFLYLAAY